MSSRRSPSGRCHSLNTKVAGFIDGLLTLELRGGGVAGAFLLEEVLSGKSCVESGSGSSRNHATAQESVSVVNHGRLPEGDSKHG
jgi:hypothetical protein